MALEGSLTDFGLADILQLIYFQRKTGVLTLESKMDKVRLIFLEGNISGAESKKRVEDNRLGKILLKKGLIGDADLKALLDEQRKTGTRLGQLAIKRGMIGRDIIEEMLSAQITETVIQLFDWKRGTYEFVSQGLPQNREFAFSLDTQHLLMDGLRVSDEWAVIKDKITLDVVYAKKSEKPQDLTKDEEEIFGYVDGESDVSTIIDLSGRDNFSVSKTLVTLAERGFIEAVEIAPITDNLLPPAPGKRASFIPYLLPAIIMIALVLSILVSATRSGNEIKELMAAEKIGDLRFRIETYRLKNSAYPGSLAEIADAKDPWGRDYVYAPSGDSFSLVSFGADGEAGSQDDIY